jgi:hypothetical protein
MVTLGINNAYSGETVAKFALDMAGIASYLLGQGYTAVILNYPTGIPATEGAAFDKLLLLAAAIPALCNGTTVLLGDTVMLDYLPDHASTELQTGGTSVHPNDTGAASVGEAWAFAWAKAVGDVPTGIYTAAANIRSGTDRGDGVTGTLAVPSAANVLSGVSVDATTGTYVVVAAGSVKTAVTFGAASAQTGTYDGSDRWTDPGVSHVQTGTTYKANSTTNNRTGTYDPITGNYTDPGVGTVQVGTTYKFAGSTLTGTYDPVTGNYTDPGIAHVQSGTTYKFGGSTLTGTFSGGGGGGTYTDPGVGNVRLGITYTFNSVSQAGTLVVPSLANTKIGVAGDGGTGTYDGSDRWSDPGIAHVEQGTSYKAGSVTVNRAGTLENPSDAVIAAAVWAYANRTLTG